MAIKAGILNNDLILKTAGACVFLFYLVAAINSSLIPAWLTIPFIMLAGPIIYLVVQHIFSIKFVNAILLEKMRNGINLLGMAFLVFTILSIVQQAGLLRYKSIESENLKGAYFLLNSIQLGFDLVFDVFYGMGIMLISKAFIDEDKKNLLGWLGITLSMALLGMNALTFPEPPVSKGYIDIGPITLLWWILLVIKIKSNSLWQKHQVK